MPIGYPYANNEPWHTYFTIYNNISKWNIDPSVKSKTLNLLEENIEENFGLGKDLSGMSPKHKLRKGTLIN